MKRITTNETGENKLLNSIVLANKVLENSEFYKKLSVIKSFDYADITGDTLSNLILNSKITAVVIIKSPLNPFTWVTAYTKPKYPNYIFIYNKYIENKNIGLVDIACTLVHEYVHLVDFEAEEYDFGHDKNFSKGKNNTAPYLIESIVREIIVNNL